MGQLSQLVYYTSEAAAVTLFSRSDSLGAVSAIETVARYVVRIVRRTYNSSSGAREEREASLFQAVHSKLAVHSTVRSSLDVDLAKDSWSEYTPQEPLVGSSSSAKLKRKGL